MQVHNNSCWRGLQVRPVVHKNTKYYVKTPDINSSLEPDGTKDRPFASINDAVSFIKDDVGDDQLKTYTIMIDGEVGPAELNDCRQIKQITLCGANGLDANNMPKDAIVGDVSNRPLNAELVKKIVIKNLKLTGGGIDPDNPSDFSRSTIGNGGGLRLYNSTIVLDSNAVVVGKVAHSGGGVCISENGSLNLRCNAQICNNIANGGGSIGQGGGAYLGIYAYFYVEGGTISGNKCYGSTTANGKHIYSQGGGVYVFNSTTFEMYGGKITGNIIEDEYVDEENGTTRVNNAGGGIYADGNNTVKICGGEISGNTSTDGADVYCKVATIGGSAYIGNICVYTELDVNTSTRSIEISDKLTTDKKMSLTFNLNNQLELGDYKPFYVLYNRNDNGQIVRDAINIFELKDSEYELEYGKDGSFCFGKLVKKQ